LSRKIYFCW